MKTQTAATTTARNKGSNTGMVIRIETPEYDSKKFGRPWIAKVSFKGSETILEWGGFIGSSGEAGVLVMEGLHEGDVVSRGQKVWGTDYGVSFPNFYKVTKDGELERFANRGAAYLHWIDNQVKGGK